MYNVGDTGHVTVHNNIGATLLGQAATNAAQVATNGTITPKWTPTTAYTLGQQVISPNNDVVSALSAHTSGATYTAGNWTVSSTYALPAKVSARARHESRAIWRGPVRSLIDWQAIDALGADQTTALVLNRTTGTLSLPSGAYNDNFIEIPVAMSGGGRVSATFDQATANTTSAPCGVGAKVTRGATYICGIFAMYRTYSPWTAASAMVSIYAITDGGASPTYTNLTGWVATGSPEAVTTATTWTVDVELEIIGNTARAYIAGALTVTATIPDAFLTTNGDLGLWLKPAARAWSVTNMRAEEYTSFDVPATLSQVLCHGTSITNGAGASGPAAYWRTLFGTQLQSRWTNGAVTVVNGGVSGSTSTDMLSRLPALLAGTPAPQLVTIETSVNDWKTAGSISTATSALNLRKMIQLVKSAGAIPVVLTSLPVNPAAYSGGTIWDANTSFSLMLAGNAATRAIAAQENVLLVDAVRGFADNNSTTYLADGIHPNDVGHSLLAQVAADVILGTRRY